MLRLLVVVRSDADEDVLEDLLGMLGELAGELREVMAGEVEYPVVVLLDGDKGDLVARVTVE